MNLRERWDDLMDRMGLEQGGATPALSTWGSLLRLLYGATTRHYHAQRHLIDVFERLDEHRARFTDPVTAELALWFHDAIYAVPSKRNEEASAEMCAAFLTSVGADKHRKAPLMIVATKHDGKMAPDQDTALVLDIDLAGFADPWDAFEANNARIRSEFAIYEEPTYRAGRAKFLRGLLERGPVFRVLTELEAPARANIERHIADLTRSA